MLVIPEGNAVPKIVASWERRPSTTALHAIVLPL